MLIIIYMYNFINIILQILCFSFNIKYCTDVKKSFRLGFYLIIMLRYN